MPPEESWKMQSIAILENLEEFHKQKREKPLTDKDRLIEKFNPLSVEDKLTNFLANEIAEEINREIVKSIIDEQEKKWAQKYIMHIE